MKAAIYARVSTTREDLEHGLPSQVQACERFLWGRARVSKWMVDPIAVGSSEVRPPSAAGHHRCVGREMV